MFTQQSCLYLLFLLFPSSVECWGKIGHEIVGNLAWSLLSETAQSAIERILQTNNTSPQTVGPSKTHCHEFCSPLAEIANWADQVRYTSYYHWSGPLHFIDIRDDQIPGRCRATNSSDCQFDYNRDCPDSFCVAGAVVNYTHRLEEQPQLVTERESLKFLVHFVGDIHQPLHCSRSSDRGGNSILVTFLNKTLSTSNHVRRRIWSHHGLNLHAVWDVSIIESGLSLYHNNSRNAFEESLFTLIEQAKQSAEWDALWMKCPNGAFRECTSEWAEESVDDALKFAYANMDGSDIESGDHLTYSYFLSRLPVVRQRLALAAVRLASTLESALAPHSAINTWGKTIPA